MHVLTPDNSYSVPAVGHSHNNGHHHHNHSHGHQHHETANQVNIPLSDAGDPLLDQCSAQKNQKTQRLPLWTRIKKELRPVLAERQAGRILWLLALNTLSIVVLLSWCSSTNSIALQAYTYTVWFNFLSLLTSLLSVWVSQHGPSLNFSLGYERWEVLAVFASTILSQLAALMVAKESVERLLEQPQIHTGRLLVGGGVALVTHLVVLYGNRNYALEHVMSAASSSWLQEHVADLSQSLCSAVPPLRALLLPRINPMLLIAATGAVAIFLTNLLIELRDYHMIDTLASLVIIVVTCATMFPMSVYSGKVLLQTTPSHIVGQLDKCLRETLTIDGVLEFRNEHFWTLSFGKMAGSLHVRVRRDADEQLVLAHVIARLSSLVPVLRVQVVKDDWSHSSSFFSTATFPPSPFTSAQPNNNLLFSGASSLDPEKFPYKPR